MSAKALRLESMFLQYLAMINQEEAIEKANAGGYLQQKREVLWSVGEYLGHPIACTGT